MSLPSFTIIPFREHYQQPVDALMASIAGEFAENIFSPQSKSLTEVSHLPGHQYWLACDGDAVLGTIGLCRLQNDRAELKRLFLHQASRGKGIAQALLDTVVGSAKENKISALYLGTMTQFRAAQAFYEKQGFFQIPESSLPGDFVVNPVDRCFYKKEL